MTQTPVSSTAPLTDVHDMVVVHRGFRREFRLIPQLVRGVAAGDVARAAVVAGHARLVLTGLHLHHTGEDAVLWPLLLERAAPSAALVHRMEAQHGRVEELVDRLPAALERWEAEARPAVAEEVASTFESLRDALFEHLDEEERHVLPLAARHVSPEEWARLGQHGKGEMDLALASLLFSAILEDAAPDERRMILRVVPPPVRLLLLTVYAWRYRRYVRRVRRGV